MDYFMSFSGLRRFARNGKRGRHCLPKTNIVYIFDFWHDEKVLDCCIPRDDANTVSLALE
jgi:hypothetical protein